MYIGIILYVTDHLEGSIWISKIGDQCVDTLRFKAKRSISEYSCEQEFTFHGKYSVSGDTVTIIEKDDSHSEDNGKPTYFRSEYVMHKNKTLELNSVSELVKNRWVLNKNPMQGNIRYERIK
jgi:hypothetical protein